MRTVDYRPQTVSYQEFMFFWMEFGVFVSVLSQCQDGSGICVRTTDGRLNTTQVCDVTHSHYRYPDDGGSLTHTPILCVCERKKETKISTNQMKSSMKRRKLNSQIKNLFLIGTRCLESWRGYKVLRRSRLLCGGSDGPWGGPAAPQGLQVSDVFEEVKMVLEEFPGCLQESHSASEECWSCWRW